MIEALVRQYLDAKLSVPIYLVIPEDKASKYVEVEKIAFSENNFIFTTTLAIKSIASSLFDAASLSEDVITALRDMVALDEISKVEITDNYNFTDTAKKVPRYQAIVELTHY